MTSLFALNNDMSPRMKYTMNIFFVRRDDINAIFITKL